MAYQWDHQLSGYLPAGRGINFYNISAVEFWMCTDYDSNYFGSTDLPKNKTDTSKDVYQLSSCNGHLICKDLNNYRGVERWVPIQEECTGHQKRRTNTFNLSINKNTQINADIFTTIYDTINAEIESRKAHQLFSDLSSLPDNNINNSDLIQTSNLTTITNKLKEICEKNLSTGTKNDIITDNPISGDIVQTTDISEAASNKLVQNINAVIQDCICYSDCVGYSVCYCYGNCSHY